MKNIILLLLLIPFYSFGQNMNTEEYFDNGIKVIRQNWIDGDYNKTIIKSFEGKVTSRRYYIERDGIEVGAYFSTTKSYGKYFRVDISIVNNSKNRIDFLENNINVNVIGNLNTTDKYTNLTFEEYNSKVIKRQKSNEILTALSVGLSNGLAGNTYSQSNSYYNNNYGYGSITTNTTSYSPTLASLQYQQNQKILTDLGNEQSKEMKYINEGYLKNNTLFPNNTLIGYFLIPYHKSIDKINFNLTIDKLIFDFNDTIK